MHSINVALIHMATESDCPFSEIITRGRFLSVAGDYYRKVPPTVRALLWLATNRPWAVDIVGRQTWRSVATNSPDWYLERSYGDMPDDYEYTRSTDIWAMMGDACAYTFMQSHVPFFDDFIVRQTDVRPLLPRLRRDMHWLLGAVEVYATDKRAGSFYHETNLDQIERDNPRLQIHKVEKAEDLTGYQQPELVAQVPGEKAGPFGSNNLF